MNWLLLFFPITIALEYLTPDQHLWIFLSAALAIVPLAGWMGRATEQIAERTGEGIGGLLNATFGNAAELIIAIAALRAGLHDVVMASLSGSIVGNILLVLGASMLTGGLRYTEQHYNAAAARSQATMLTVATIALILPAAYRVAAGEAGAPALGEISVWFSLILLIVYGANLIFSLVTHWKLFAGSPAQIDEAGADNRAAQPLEKVNGVSSPGHQAVPLWQAAVILAAATAAIAWVSEILVGALEPAGAALGLNDTFMGVFVVAILGNAAEHSTAVMAAMKNRMDLAISIAIGSSVQVALFVAPLLVLLSRFVGPTPMDLAFPGGLVLTILLAVWIAGQVTADGRSDWLRGVQLIAVYAILALIFLYLPPRN